MPKLPEYNAKADIGFLYALLEALDRRVSKLEAKQDSKKEKNSETVDNIKQSQSRKSKSE